MDLEFRHDYWEDRPRRAAFQAFIREIHGLDFTRWQQAGYWDAAYRPFTYFDGTGRVVASVCAYELDLVVDGRLTQATQISGVGTARPYRRRGLNRRLTEAALEASGRELTFLFADEAAVPFYRRCGFRFVEEGLPSVAVDGGEPASGLRQLDLDDAPTRRWLASLAANRTPVSERLGVMGVPLFMFHALYTMRDCLFHLPSLDLVIAFRSEGARLTLYDIVGAAMPSLDSLLPYLRTPETREVVFRFVPDRLNVSDVSWRPFSDHQLHVRRFPLAPASFLFPFTAHA